MANFEELVQKHTDESGVIQAKAIANLVAAIKQAVGNEYYKKAEQAKATRAQKTDAYRAMLKEIGVNDKRIDAILKVTDLDGIELDAEGKLKDAADLKKSAKAEWSDFIVTTHTQGAQTATPPSGKVAPKSREEIMKIKDPTERQKEWGAYLAAQKG